MKVTEHVEYLLRQGRKPKELVEFGFPKLVVTRVHKKLRKEKAALKGKVPEGTPQVESHLALPAPATGETARMEQQLAPDRSEPRDSMKPVDELRNLQGLVAAARDFGTYKYDTCPYGKDGICPLWTWPSQSEIPRDIGEPVLGENGKSEWHVRPSPFYCALCTASVEGRLDEVESEVSANPLSGAEYQITCKGCGSRGYIAAAIKCTKCGRETYWGWFPKKE
jgi:hypothetical protein